MYQQDRYALCGIRNLFKKAIVIKKKIMKKETKIIILLYLLLVAIKIFLANYVSTPTEFGDGYMYTKMARAMFYWNAGTLNVIDNSFYPPLYPLLLSLLYSFDRMQVIYLAMKVLNAFLSSIIIFPVFFLAKENYLFHQ